MIRFKQCTSKVRRPFSLSFCNMTHTLVLCCKKLISNLENVRNNKDRFNIKFRFVLRKSGKMAYLSFKVMAKVISERKMELAKYVLRFNMPMWCELVHIDCCHNCIPFRNQSVALRMDLQYLVISK